MDQLMENYFQELNRMQELCRSIKYELRKEQQKYIALGDNMRIRHEEELRKQFNIICRIEDNLNAQYRAYMDY